MAEPNPCWRFSLALYEAEGVAELCLGLQERYGLDVCLLLYLAWRASRRERLAPPALRGLREAVGGLREELLSLRAARLRLRGEPRRRAAYRRLKDAELALERRQQDVLYAADARLEKQPRQCLADNIAPYCRELGMDAAAIAALVARLGEALEHRPPG